MEISTELAVLLFATAIAAGFIDSIAGGGGLLAMPVLLWIGLPPLTALGTNKLQGTVGTLTASLNYLKSGLLRPRQITSAVTAAFLGSALGTWSVQQVDSQLLAMLIPTMLMLSAVYFLVSPRVTDEDAQPRLSMPVFAGSIAFAIGFYDGFFGPGTGSFFVIALVMLLGYGLTRATAATKLLNFSSNLASLLFFAYAGSVDWRIGLLMAGGQLVGSYAGSHLGIRHGARLIKPLLVSVSVILSVKLLTDNLQL